MGVLLSEPRDWFYLDKTPIARTQTSRIGASPPMCIAFPNAYFDSLGLPRLADSRST